MDYDILNSKNYLDSWIQEFNMLLQTVQGLLSRSTSWHSKEKSSLQVEGHFPLIETHYDVIYQNNMSFLVRSR